MCAVSTYHASIDRTEEKVLEKQVLCFTSDPSIKKLLDSLNIFIVIVNTQRQIVYANSTFLMALGMEDSRRIIGKRPGEAISCIHAYDNEGGCGTGEACRGCNAVNLMLKSMHNGQVAKGEIAITFENRGFELPLNMFENVTPIEMCGDTFYLISMLDISDAQRRRILERIFFHDIINTSGALKGLVGMLKYDVPDEVKPDVEFVELAFNGLVEEIIEQKQILDAENNELSVDKITLVTSDVVSTIVKMYRNHDVSSGKIINVSQETEEMVLKSDFTLLKRVLGNMAKNALEAKGTTTVEIGCRKIEDEGFSVEFWIWNNAFIPKDIQLRIFQRSFSTKGKNRGIGTYSMKLLGERYLGGKVGFTSSEANGTRFFLKLPGV